MGYPVIVPILGAADWNAYQGLFFLFMGIALFIVILLIFLVYALAAQTKKAVRRGSSDTLKQTLRYLLEIYQHVLFIPSLYLFLLMFQCRETQPGVYTHNVFTGQKCFSGGGITYTVLGALFAVI